MSLFTRVARGRLAAWLTVAAALVVGAVVFGLPRPANPDPVSATGLSVEWQSTQVERLQNQLPSSGVQPAVVVVSRADKTPLSEADRTALADASGPLSRLAAGGRVAPAQFSPDGTVALVAVPLSTAGGQQAVVDEVAGLRAALGDLPDALTVQVTGAPAFTADLTKVFEGADVTLLAVTAAVVALLLLVTYRSPFLWLVPLLVVAATEQITLRAVDTVVPALGIHLQDGQVTGIASVLVFGAATDYALLLIARYREELRREENRFTAMRAALRRTAEPILASGSTVVLGVLTLLLSEQETNRALAVACATGVLFAMLSALFVLPAALVLFGRGLFWPFVPRLGSPAREGRLWGRLGAAVIRRPAPVAALATLLLAGLALGGLGIRTGLSETEQFRAKPEAVAGAETLARAFPAGTTQPVAVLTNPRAAPAVLAAAGAVDGVASARPGPAGDRIAQVDVVLEAEPGTAASDRAVAALRDAVVRVPGSAPPAVAGAEAPRGAVVGGTVAAAYDAERANTRDLRLILPVILLLVGAVLVLLLRGLVAPVLLVLTVIASFFASLGAAWLLFDHVLGFPALDSGVLLLAFVFLVALGVDYNIFLVTRAREDARRTGTRDGMLSALRVTGGVITSAGVLLAAVFAVLGVLPLITLTQIGIIVCVGVLLDTLLVRTVLVPALAFLLGDRFWWPSRVRRVPEDPGAAAVPAEPVGAGD
ncbi:MULTISPECIES: MMPL family transporter [Micromonospora]|uniref:MMPL family transporter n=1 Tax=Micromonospora solifontis TaxID=2487138 RepID=A0ABX9WAP3_9ACTN|nr:MULTISPECIES: MMPL family transporter [Micromonospora]NES12149.1 MMPL family transporter [Micromonospora sp. PPF5-17B]NES38878.1 MMPL family transporter [Micromonospora solifontis]NES54368.1 MMPL family transporter [Micromonospora sp. PPF5-6]RNL92637.1 MMPL family transporter [Micromonospora solifontis]